MLLRTYLEEVLEGDLGMSNLKTKAKKFKAATAAAVEPSDSEATKQGERPPEQKHQRKQLANAREHLPQNPTRARERLHRTNRTHQ